MNDQRVTAKEEGSSNSQLISASVLMATGTMASRVVGFLRVVLIAFVLGNGTRQAEMFTFANTIPNSIYILLAGGALNTVLVPQIVRAVKHDEDRGEAYTNRIMTAFLLILAAVTLAVTLAAPWIIRLYTDGQWRDPSLGAQYDSMVTLAYLCLPQVFFYGAFFLAGQVLNARGRFGPMMWAPVANNLVSIAVFALYLAVWGVGDGVSSFTPTQEWVLGGGATLGIFVQAAIMVPFLRAAGFHYRPRFDLRHTGLGHTFHLAKWTLGFVIVTQAALVVVNRLASRAAVGGDGGGLTVYNNAYLLWILPHSLITVSLATAMLPSASRLAAEGDLAGVRDESIRTMRLATTVLLPAAVAFLALAIPVSDLLFKQGAGSEDWIYVAWALMGFAVGLIPFTLHYVCLRTFYALEDTRSTFFLQVIIAVANAALALVLVLVINRPSLIAAALAVAYSLAYGLGVVIAFRWLGRKLPGLSAVPVLRHCLRVFLAVLPGGLAAAAITWGFRQWSVSKPAVALSLVVAGVVAVGLFLLLARLLHITEVNQIVATIGRRNRGSGEVGAGSAGDDSPGDGDSAAPATGSSPTIGGAGESAGVAAVGIPTMGEQDDEQDAVRTTTAPLGEDPDATAEFVPSFDDDSGSDDGSEDVVADEDDFTDASPVPRLANGDVLGGRYRLEEALSERGSAITWRAFDQVLSRSVVCHLVGRDDPRCADILAAARRAAAATDSRFLRVLDAVQPSEGEVGCYIVTEYSAGHSVEDLLAAGPLSGLEAAWLVREVGDAIAGVHALGLSHLRISPATTIITPTGNVQIAGLLTEEAFDPEHGALPEAERPDDPQQADVLDLGRLLMATLVSRWPGGNEFGLPEAPRDSHDHWLTPRQIRAGVSPALDQIADQILSPTPRHHAAPLESAGDIVQALSKVLGSADASADLERRLRQPVPLVGAREDVPRSPTTAWYEQSPEAETTTLPVAESPATTSTAVAPPQSPATPRTAPAARPPRRRWPVVLALLVVVAILLTVGVLYLNGRGTGGNAGEDPSPSAPAEAGPYEIAEGIDFDPEADNGSGDENPDEVPLAFDGDPETRWRTLAYKNNPEMGGLKPGVGLVLDLGEAREVGTVDLVLTGNATAVEIRVPAGDDPASVSEPPLETEGDWRTVGADEKAGATASIGLEEKVTTRFVLVYLTSLPKEKGVDYRGAIHEVEVLG